MSKKPDLEERGPNTELFLTEEEMALLSAFNKTIGVPALRSGAVSVHKHTPTEVKLPPATQGSSAGSNNGSGNNSSSSQSASASNVIVGNARGVQALRKSKSDRGANDGHGPETEGK
eukprot:INCI13250.1.p1 GENE.INCI13250.1~~INCI13250.1.p1  ORF type:complete len:117 (+),score=23.24 INCI13250.1:139-489(+)